MKKILIVGGGLSGLTAAYQLSKSNRFEITILEKSDRVGGRVKTIQVNGVNIDVGGFIVFKWYKSFRNLLSELNLQNDLRELRKGSHYWFINNVFAQDFNFKFTLKQKVVLVIKILPSLFTYNNDFFEPKISSEKLGLILQKILGPNHLFISVIKAYFESFTYPSISKLEYKISIAVLMMMVLKGRVEESDMMDGTDKLINKLKDSIQLNNGKIFLNKEVTSVLSNKVICSDDSEFLFDKIIIATPHLNLFQNYLNIGQVDSTTTYSAIIELESEPKINKENWISTFHEPNGSSEQIISIIDLNWMTYNALNKKFILAYVKSDSKKQLAEKEVLNFIKKDLNTYFPDCEVVRLHSVTFWQKNMPIISVEDIKRIRQSQGKNNMYFTGDYLSFPSMEAAVFNGNKVAKIVSG